MSYCRMGYDGSDAYCYESSAGYVVFLEGAEKHVFSTPKECADFLIACRERGLTIPQYAIDALLDEAA
jgi:hypothetical protein